MVVADYHRYNKNLKEKARILRQNMTECEKMLWFRFLRTFKVKFYRQRIIENFIADFYCPKAKLIIEIDGGQHHTEKGTEYDKYRTEILNKHNIDVLRFDNKKIIDDFNDVCDIIIKTVNDRIQ